MKYRTRVANNLRNRFICRPACTSVVVLLFLLTTACGSENESENRARETSHPNIVYILADDLGYGDIGPFGQEKIITPNLDRMAAEGMRFTQHYSGSTVCAPS